MTISKFLSDAFRENTSYGGLIHCLVLWIWNRAVEHIISNQMSPFQSFTSFLYIPYFSPGHNLYLLPWGLWGGGFILENMISRPFNYLKQNCYLKILIRSVWENGGRRRGLVALQSLLTIKRALSVSIFNRVSSFRSFYNNKWPSQNFHQTHFGKIQGLGGGHPSSNHSESEKGC